MTANPPTTPATTPTPRATDLPLTPVTPLPSLLAAADVVELANDPLSVTPVPTSVPWAAGFDVIVTRVPPLLVDTTAAVVAALLVELA
jgi:hypothetical protein